MAGGETRDLSLWRIEGLKSLVHAFSEALTPPRVAAAACEHALGMLDARGAIVALRDTDAGSLAIAHVEGLENAPTADFLVHASLDDTMRSRLAIFLDTDVELDAGFPRLDDGTRAQSLAFLPLLTRRRVIGVLVIAFDRPAAFDQEERAFMELLAQQTANAVERGQLHHMEEAWTRQVEEESTRFRSLVQELDAVFWEADPETFLFSFVSERATPLLGYPTARWLQPGFWASIIHPEDRAWAVGFCVECTRQGQDHVFEYRLKAADGRVVWVRDVVYVVRDAEGRPTRLRGVMLDVTHERDGTAKANLGRVLSRPR